MLLHTTSPGAPGPGLKCFRAYKYELDPNNLQRTALNRHARAARYIWNWGLTDRIRRFKENEGKAKFIGFFDQNKLFNAVKKTEDHSWYLEGVGSAVQLWTLRALDETFRRFWKMRKQGMGFPRFKARGKTADAFTVHGGIRTEGRRVRLPVLGWVRLKEKPEQLSQVKHVTCRQEAGRWYVSLLTEAPAVETPPPPPGKPVGVDLGLTCFAAVSNGRMFQAPKPLKKYLRKLARLQRAASRKQKGSANRRKAVAKVAKLYRRIANVRGDFLHKLTTKLATGRSAIAIEDLAVRNLSQGRTLARAISDAGWGEFRRQLEYKCPKFGSQLVVAGRFFASSKLCSRCGWRKDDLARSEPFRCDSCGLELDRDLNAARNLEKLCVAGAPPETENACGGEGAGRAAQAPGETGPVEAGSWWKTAL